MLATMLIIYTVPVTRHHQRILKRLRLDFRSNAWLYEMMGQEDKLEVAVINDQIEPGK